MLYEVITRYTRNTVHVVTKTVDGDIRPIFSEQFLHSTDMIMMMMGAENRR